MGVIRSAAVYLEQWHPRRQMREEIINDNGGCDRKKRDMKLADVEKEEKMVCVTSGISSIGKAIVTRLLNRGYSIRVAVDNEGDVEKAKELEAFGDPRVRVVVGKVLDFNSLCEAFHSCCGVFHTSAFVDPNGVTGYTKFMVEMETRAAQNVMEACAATPTVKRCVMHSSLLACIWQRINNDLYNLSVVDENSWSDIILCRELELWMALGKTMAERVAWTVAEEKNVKLSTVCSAMAIEPNSQSDNSAATIAYLKGSEMMIREGLLATANINRVADAHVIIFDEMDSSSGVAGRYICFDNVIDTEEQAMALDHRIGIPGRISGHITGDFDTRFTLSNGKLTRLMARQLQGCRSFHLNAWRA